MAGIVKFLGDTHAEHKKIFTPRGFSTLEDHDLAICRSIADNMNSRDCLVLTGDICFGSPDKFFFLIKKCLEERYGWRMDKINFDIKVVQGNHDKTSMLQYCKDQGYINSFSSLLEYKHEGKKYVVTHVPIHPCSMERWDYNIHGHTHAFKLDDERYINTSWEQYLAPMSIAQIQHLRSLRV